MNTGYNIYMYSFLERHTDGYWWYHPRSTFDTPEDAEKNFQERFWWDLDRPHIIVKHKVEFPQDYSRSSMDLLHFGFGGLFDYEIKCEIVNKN